MRRNLKKKEILFWKNKYNNEEDIYDKTCEKELRIKIQKNKFLTKKDLIKIVKWKFPEGSKTFSRQLIILPLLQPINDAHIRKITYCVFKINDDRLRLKLLCCIDGVGNAIASTILSFYNPKKYGILDIHSWRELFGKEPKDVFSNTKHTMKFFQKLREISSETQLSCRDIEKALFKKNKDESTIA
jgi:hypothetical protein